MTSLATQFIQRTYQEPYQPTILRRLANNDATAVKDCIDSYGGFVWAIAKKFTSSSEEAEAAAGEIFTEIWKYAATAPDQQTDEQAIISLIAKRRLFKYLI